MPGRGKRKRRQAAGSQRLAGDERAQIVFLTPEGLAEDGYGNRSCLTTGAGYLISANSNVGNADKAGC
ncbi:hypothetical protein [Streptomyces sp. NPDC059701]|uniref:hypothetical protein n=1 Tax=Streptomyces sp. NPDC059701 TaxID=3346914 RepID=UPI003693CE3B